MRLATNEPIEVLPSMARHQKLQSNTGCGSGCAPTSCQTSPQDRLVDIEDYKTELAALRRRTKELEGKLTNLHIKPKTKTPTTKFRSSLWFNNPANPCMSALYAERYLNYGLTRDELMSGKPIVGIAQTGSDLSPCNRHHIELAKRVREGIIASGGIPLEFPTHPIQETTRRPTATLDRNLMYLGLVETLHGYPLDGVVLLTGCDKTTPACLMAASTVNIPAICLNVGPMLNGRISGSNMRIGSGSIIWKARELHAAGKINEEMILDMVVAGTPSVGHCNTMGTASTMNALAEALGMALPGSSAIPAAYRQRGQCAYETGKQIVEMVRADRKPSDIMTRKAFENAIAVNSAIGGSSNAPVHLVAIAKHVGVKLDLDDWDEIGHRIPLIVNVQPAGEMLCEEYYNAGGLPAVAAELLAHNKVHPHVLTCNGKTFGENNRGKQSWDRRTIKSYDKPLKQNAGFIHMKGTLFNSAIMKTSVISDWFRQEFLEDPRDPMAFECKAVVFDGPEDYHARIEDPNTLIDRRTILVMRGAGPMGYPGAAEVVNMTAPGRLIKKGVQELPCIGDGRQSGTSAAPSILNAAPEAAAGGNLALLEDGDRLRVDLKKRRVDVLIPAAELQRRRELLEKDGGFEIAEAQTPWQEIFRRETGQLDGGMVIESAVKYQRIAQKYTPRDNH